VTFKYGFPQYNKPAAAASKQLGIKVGKEHETVVLTKGKDGSDQYKVSLQSQIQTRGVTTPTDISPLQTTRRSSSTRRISSRLRRTP
jgi:hypothetical protein